MLEAKYELPVGIEPTTFQILVECSNPLSFGLLIYL